VEEFITIGMKFWCYYQVSCRNFSSLVYSTPMQIL